MGTSLESREDRLVDFLCELFIVPRENHAAAWTAQGLVRRRRNDIEAVVEGVPRSSAGNEAGDVRHVCNRVRADLLCNLYKLRVVELPAVRREPREDDFRLVLKRHLPQIVVVNLAGVHVLHLVPDEVEYLVDGRCRVAVGEVPAVLEVHAEDGVTGL